MRQALAARRWKELIRQSDVLLARNLEMAVIADCARIWSGASTRLAYECLDIHGLLLRHGLSARMLRVCERRLLRRSSAFIVSSPGFLTHHFNRLGVRLPPVIVAENKRMPPANEPGRPQLQATRDRPPWRVGWFGILRCTRSFGILRDLAQRHPDLIDVELRGRPTGALQSLIDRHLPLPNMRFRGPYALSDLGSLYGDRDLTWAIELWQGGENADWLLPNRIYEGGYFNCPPIALAGTETAKWLAARGAGVIVRNPEIDLETFITTLTPTWYAALKRSVAAIPTADLMYSADECRRITGLLCGGSATE
ncbi:MAG TPA: hypothetical protein VE690_16205 [Rhodopila sp.]|nr:hypothetical protein [Rhodopila sp.]